MIFWLLEVADYKKDSEFSDFYTNRRTYSFTCKWIKSHMVRHISTIKSFIQKGSFNSFSKGGDTCR